MAKLHTNTTYGGSATRRYRQRERERYARLRELAAEAGSNPEAAERLRRELAESGEAHTYGRSARTGLFNRD